jgi:aspartyl-tRNA synthetase
MERTYVSDLTDGKKVLLKGWVHEIRDLAKLKFILLRDYTGIVQCVLKSADLIDKTSNLTLESAVEIQGVVKASNVKAKYARSDIEVIVEKYEIIHRAEKLPIQINDEDVETELSTRLDYRFLDIRSQKFMQSLKLNQLFSQHLGNL